MILTVVCGLEEEAGTVTRRDDLQVIWGTARHNLDKVVARGCTRIISFGVAGALNPKLKIGDLVIPNAVVNEHEMFLVDTHTQADLQTKFPQAIVGGEYSTGIIEGDTPEERLDLYKRFNCNAVDDESIFIARFASLNKIPFAVIRSISDNHETFLPAWILEAVDARGKSSFSKILTGIKDHPSDIDDLVKVGLNFKKSLSVLKRVNGILFT